MTGPLTNTLTEEIPAKFNAYRHGVTGQVLIITPEDEVAYKTHCQMIYDSLVPVGGLEIELAQDIADGRWRIKIAAAMQINILAMGVNDNEAVAGNHPQVDTAVKQARAFVKRGGSFNTLSLYEQRIHRKVRESLSDLLKMQAVRRASIKEVVEEVVVMAQQAQRKGKSFDFERDYPIKLLHPNLVCSPPEIVRLVAAKTPLRIAA